MFFNRLEEGIMGKDKADLEGNLLLIHLQSLGP